jgi:DNA-binding NarL/FixJ family response regulator
MAAMSGFEAAARIRQIAPSTKIVFMSIHEIPIAARLVGADAFVSKSNAAQELIAAIERVTGEPRNPHAKAQSA